MDHPKTAGRPPEVPALTPRYPRRRCRGNVRSAPWPRPFVVPKRHQPLLPPGRRRGGQRAVGQEEWGPGLALRQTQSPRVGGSRHSPWTYTVAVGT